MNLFPPATVIWNMYISKYVLINTISDILELLFLDEPKL